MIRQLIKFSFLIFCATLFISCNTKTETESATAENGNFKQLVEEWNKAHATKDVAVFSTLFAKSVLFYGVQYDKNSCIEGKLSVFKKSPDFYQQIFGDIQIDLVSDYEVKCSFIKRVTVNQSTKDYPSYLTFKKYGDEWLIAVEGDLVTDKNLAKKSTKNNNIPNTKIKGDFNGDGKLDYLWIVAPKISETEESGCIGECTSYIKFSDPSIPDIKIESCIGGTPVNHGDLNQNGTDEIGLLPDWFSSCWSSYFVWTLINNKWIYAVEPFSTHCNQWEEGINPIEIDNNRPGNVIIRYSDFSEETGSGIKSKSIKIAK